ncbi:hypothetical protein HK098_000975 [Nowakowskiella sp. JEL0407]|nr:hypothetical protein HK098_000975 [Nowakowskiella sp. JEL0407]
MSSAAKLWLRKSPLLLRPVVYRSVARLSTTSFVRAVEKTTTSTSAQKFSSSSAEPAAPPPAPSEIAPEEEALSTSFSGASVEPFPKEIADILLAEIKPDDIEIKPDGLLYLPEIKYRRILNKAFGPGGWALVPRSGHTVNSKNISREYALFCLGRFVAQARGEQDYFGGEDALATASEGCKSNAMLRCCKDLGIASELWDPVFIRDFKEKHCQMVAGTHVVNNSKKMIWKKKGRDLDYPYKESTGSSFVKK